MQMLIKNALLRSETEKKDIVIDNGIIVDINKAGKTIATNFEQIIDAAGSLVTESLTSPHIHLDKVLIGEKIVNKSGNLWEAIEKTWEYKKNYTIDDIVTRASRVIDKQIEYGVTHIRTHVDVDSIGKLMPVKGLLETKKKYKDIIDLQIVAFPQEGIIKDEGTAELLRKALELGADVMGGMPHNEYTDPDRLKHVNTIFDIAEEFKVPIDSHTDETDDPSSRTLELMAGEVMHRKFKYGVTVDHICALTAYEPYHADRVIGWCKAAGINVESNPPTNMVLQGRLDQMAQRVGTTRIKEFIAAGVNVTIGQDCVKDPYYPFGDGDMLEVANLCHHSNKMTLPHEIEQLYDMITINARKVMNLHGYKVAKGNKADIVILHGVTNVWDALRVLPRARTVIRAGKVLSDSKYTVQKYY